VILPLAGFRSRAGAMEPILVWIATTAGSIVGALGRRLGYNRLRHLAGKRWFLITSPEGLDHGRSLFDRTDSCVVAAACCLPGPPQHCLSASRDLRDALTPIRSFHRRQLRPLERCRAAVFFARQPGRWVRIRHGAMDSDGGGKGSK
jgi:hypothetical protein